MLAAKEGGGGGLPPTQQRAHTVRGQQGKGDGPRAPTAHGPSQDEGGDPLEWQHALPVHSMPKQEEGDLPSQAEEGAGD